MTTDRILDRVRAANSAPTVTIGNQELFAQIVASPGDPRLGEAKRWGSQPLRPYPAASSLEERASFLIWRISLQAA